MKRDDAIDWIERNARSPQRISSGQWSWYVSTMGYSPRTSIHRLPFDIFEHIAASSGDTDSIRNFPSRADAIDSLILAVMKSSPDDIKLS